MERLYQRSGTYAAIADFKEKGVDAFVIHQRVGVPKHLQYMAGNHYGGGEKLTGVYTRTSTDLIHGSEYSIASLDPALGTVRWRFECPHVVEREGYYYLFLTQDYAGKKTSVYRSINPADFGIGSEAQKHFVGLIEVGAPEIIVGNDGKDYITSNHDLHGGTCIRPLEWVEETGSTGN